ncbi:MAG: enoyl-CoA hydratase/isomerase family protein [Xanthobacteraceae bacterium]
MNSASEIVFDRRGAAGVIVLNRPEALNAVSHAMVGALARQLIEWESDPAVSRVIITAAAGRAFSAGGDLRALYDLGRARRYPEMLSFFRDEYTLNLRIKHYRKPYVALIDGIVMGGGVGISVHGSHRVAGDRFAFAMPEVGIGFFPDVGATWFLPRLPGELGTYCALTGERLDADMGVAAGVATHRIASARFGDLIDALCTATPVDAVLAAFATAVPVEPLQMRRAVVDGLFCGEEVEDILMRLDAAAGTTAPSGTLAAKAAAAIRTKSPTSLKLALAQMRCGAILEFTQCMRTEYRIVSSVVRGHDFYEGVRAVIVDKDQAPQWRPATLAEVSGADIARHLAPVCDDLHLS